MNLKFASVSLAGLVLVAIATQANSQAGADVTSQPAQRGGPAPMPKPITLSSRPDATGGEKYYVEKCAMCHGPNGMGYGLLARRLDQPDLEKRDNLAAAYVMMAARRGIGNMPSIPSAEVSDAQLKAIADYLAAGPHPDAKGGGQ